MHPIYWKRCKRDDLEPELMWLGEEVLEPDDGRPVPIEQPNAIQTPPLSMKNREDRIRMVFGLTHDDPLPEIGSNSLQTYYRYLAAELRFPFTAMVTAPGLPHTREQATFSVTGLLDPEADEAIEEEDGLTCTGRRRGEEFLVPLSEIEVKRKGPNVKLISDYSYWFHNWPWESESDEEEDSDEAVGSDTSMASLWILVVAILVVGLAGGLTGATFGAALKAIAGAGLAAQIGGIPLAVLGAWMLGRYGIVFGAVNRMRSGGFLLGVVAGLVLGGLLGVFAGLTVLTFLWSLAGAIAGVIVGPYFVPRVRRLLGSSLGAFLGICAGTLASAYWHDPTRALAGAVSGLDHRRARRDRAVHRPDPGRVFPAGSASGFRCHGRGLRRARGKIWKSMRIGGPVRGDGPRELANRLCGRYDRPARHTPFLGRSQSLFARAGMGFAQGGTILCTVQLASGVGRTGSAGRDRVRGM